MAAKTLEINSKEIHLMKPVTGAEYNEKTVLTNSSWEFVSLWLRRQPGSRAKRALFYWEQAKSFYDASELLPIESKPLTAYYCCMNAAKALLAIKGPTTIDFNGTLTHGISSNRKQWGKSTNLKNAEVIFNASGVLFELSRYFKKKRVKKHIRFMTYFTISPVSIEHFPLHTSVQNFLFQFGISNLQWILG